MSDKEVKDTVRFGEDAHFKLVTIHPWADGNGRMARLMMNWLQFEFGLIPSRIFADEKEEYIKSLVETREKNDLTIFRKFMTESLSNHIEAEIRAYKQSLTIEESKEKPEIKEKSKEKSKEKILHALRENPYLTSAQLQVELGLSRSGIEKALRHLKQSGRIVRVGPDKGGYWQVFGF